MRAIIFVNGIVAGVGWIADLVRDDDYLIGADGGTYHCLAIGRVPHIVIGDLDSLELATKEELVCQGVQIEKHPVEKDQPDLELPLELAIEHHATEIILVGALGGRLDQMLANLLILAQREWPVPVKLVDDRQTAQHLRSGETIQLSGQVGDTVSAIPLSDLVTGITYTGLRYPLTNATLTLGSTWGVSNELAAEVATITVESGILLVVTIQQS